MQSSRLWQIYSELKTEDHLRVDKWLDSPYFNRRADLRTLWASIRGLTTAPSREGLWNEVFPGQPFRAPAFNRCCSRLTQQLEAYLADQFRQAEGPVQHCLDLARAYHLRDAPGDVRKSLDRMDRALGRTRHRNADFFLHQFEMKQLRYNAQFLTTQRTTEGLKEMSDALDTWFVLQKLRQACSHVAQQRVGTVPAPLGFLDEVIRQVQAGHFDAFPAIQIYHAAFQMLRLADGQTYFDTLNDLLDAHASIFPPEELRSVYLMAINNCVRQINLGVPGALADVYALYKKGLADGWIFEKGKLSPWTYKNIVSAGLKLEDYGGVEQFLAKYSRHLPGDIRDAHHRYNLAELQFARADYPQVLQSLAAILFRDPLTELRARILQIKAAFELQEVDLVGYQLDNLRKFISRKQNLSYHRSHYRNFERLTRQLLSLKPGPQARQKVRQAIETEAELVERDWLMQKVWEVGW